MYTRRKRRFRAKKVVYTKQVVQTDFGVFYPTALLIPHPPRFDAPRSGSDLHNIVRARTTDRCRTVHCPSIKTSAGAGRPISRTAKKSGGFASDGALKSAPDPRRFDEKKCLKKVKAHLLRFDVKSVNALAPFDKVETARYDTAKQRSRP